MARLIETATEPLRTVDVDVVTLDLVENALRNARYEMDEVLFRTALSPGIREQHDEFPLIGNPEGKMVVGQFGLSIPDFLENFHGDIEEGDVLLTSDPYSCGAAISHANDWLVVIPIYYEGRIVGWSSMFGHMSDVGGKTPASTGSSPPAAPLRDASRRCAPGSVSTPTTPRSTSCWTATTGR